MPKWSNMKKSPCYHLDENGQKYKVAKNLLEYSKNIDDTKNIKIKINLLKNLRIYSFNILKKSKKYLKFSQMNF